MKVGIVGLGVVGKAHKVIFPDAVEYDLDKGSQEKINGCNIVFVCVPTPTVKGEQDLQAVEEVVSWIEAPIIVLKSTVLPGTTQRLIKQTGKNIIFSPELLRHKTSNEDIKTEPLVLCGARKFTDRVAKAYGKPYTAFAKPEYGELLKYVLNSYLATKVAYFNQIFDLCEALNLDYAKLRRGVLRDKRIGETHTKVTKERGYGGACFPKDMDAFVRKYKGKVSVALEAAEYNKKVRLR